MILHDTLRTSVCSLWMSFKLLQKEEPKISTIYGRVGMKVSTGGLFTKRRSWNQIERSRRNRKQTWSLVYGRTEAHSACHITQSCEQIQWYFMRYAL